MENEKVISLQDAIKIGEFHNSYLSNIVNNYPKDIESLKREFLNFAPKELSEEITNDIFSYFENDIEKQNQIIIENLSSQTSVSLYKEISEIVSNVTSYREVSLRLDEKLSDIEKEVGRDKEILLTLVETSRASLKFWLPTSEGGDGNGDIVIEQFPNATARRQVNWGQIGYADGAGAVGVLIRTWYLAAWGPLSWGTILGAIGWGAAWGSGTALLYQLM
ncbi:MAG: hypothetical protein Q4F57_07320 [Weeksellaceae bacterium]|nr:hypothetical protein [Weeksellaceae bacterium]